MFGREKNEKPLLTLDPEELANMQRMTREMLEALVDANRVAKEALDNLAVATRELNRATAELKRARQKRDSIIRNTP